LYVLLILLRAEEKAANDLLQGYLLEIQQSYVQKQVERKVKLTKQAKYFT